jgi:hypothetical protein
MKRRRLLAASATAATVSLAGCGSPGGDDGGEDPYDLEEPERVEHPARVEDTKRGDRPSAPA